MNYEEKYKSALKWMQSLYSGLHGATKEDAEKYFPELKESKDERIRKTLIAFFRDWERTKSHCWNVNVTDIIAWLEKQGHMLDPDKVVEWLNDQACKGWIEDVEVEKFVDKFKKDFEL